MKKIIKYLSLIIALVLSTSNIASSQNIPNYVPQNGLIGWWPFDGNADDYSVKSDHGVIQNLSLTEDRFGNCNQAYHFDSLNSHIKLDSFKFSSYTYSIWVKLDSVNTNSPTFHPLIKLSKSNESIIATYPFSQTELTTHYGNSSSTYARRNDVNMQNSNFHNIIVSFHANKGRVYFNGKLIDTVGPIRFPSEISIEKIIGRDPSPWLNSFPFKGTIDDVGLWSRELTTSEISLLYRANNYYNLIYRQPEEQNIDSLENATFTVVSNRSNVSFQWQIFSNGSFIDLQSGGQFKNINSDTLTIERVTSINHYSKYRCLVNSADCSDSSNAVRLIVNQQVGIKELLSSDNKLLVSNNPSQNLFSITVDNSLLKKRLSIFSSFGKLVNSFKITNIDFNIDATNWNNGIYYIKIDGEQFSKKLLKI